MPEGLLARIKRLLCLTHTTIMKSETAQTMNMKKDPVNNKISAVEMQSFTALSFLERSVVFFGNLDSVGTFSTSWVPVISFCKDKKWDLRVNNPKHNVTGKMVVGLSISGSLAGCLLKR